MTPLMHDRFLFFFFVNIQHWRAGIELTFKYHTDNIDLKLSFDALLKLFLFVMDWHDVI